MSRDYAAWAAYIEAHRATPFAWGAADCARFAGGAVAALTGANPLDRLGRDWRTRRGAVSTLRRLGGMAAAVGRVLTPVTPVRAGRGDVAGVPTPDGDLLLAVVEGETLVGLSPDGLVRLPREMMTHAWSAA